ncbi:hypothetical protein BKH41_08550 [Helicobacter sp. 12S02232-10]|uniref:hypothetical protein n=1 Tax=Helicobacter sp. 12S02232-10 TaxID=1476197 RepID=UPI000BA4F365|nr:hypothetical protein [Helicobacter sp. 12S02232-10]PAF46749.1 hypothetical protein BKH41_08550 [Helicobacter sp. 12S02232-10]
MNRTNEILIELSKKYIWWQKPQETIQSPEKIILKTMDIGTFEDANILLENFDKQFLIETLQKSEIGSMRKKSWHYWHIILGICDYNHIPPMPTKRVKNVL